MTMTIELRKRWQRAGELVADHDDAERERLGRDVRAAERAIVEVVDSATEPLSPSRVLELLARQESAVRQSTGALAIQRLVARGELRLRRDALLEPVIYGGPGGA